MSATVCFFLATALQCNTVLPPVTWPPEGAGARLCAVDRDSLRCQSISRDDGVKLVNKYQCVQAQINLSHKSSEIEKTQRSLKEAEEKLQSAKQTVAAWKSYAAAGGQLQSWRPKDVNWERKNVAFAQADLASARQSEIDARAQVERLCPGR
jgi:hypothetical protein